MAPQDFLFFISQIGEPGSSVRQRADDIQELIIEKAVEQLGQDDLDVIRADQDNDPGRISTRIVQQIVEARIVVVDATGRNPNVFYELGIAHAFQKPVVLLADSTDSIPFDTQDQKHLLLGDDGAISARAAENSVPLLAGFLEMVCEAGYRPTSPVAEASLIASLSDRENPEGEAMTLLLDRMASMEAKFDSMQVRTGSRRPRLDSGMYTTSNGPFDWRVDKRRLSATVVRFRDKKKITLPLPDPRSADTAGEHIENLEAWRLNAADTLVDFFDDEPSMPAEGADAIASLVLHGREKPRSR